MNGVLLDVRDLHVAIRQRQAEAVVGASFTASRGEVVGIVGESGSGKSLSLRAIAGLLPRGVEVTGGDIYFGDENLVSASSPALRAIRGRRIAMVFQEPMTALNPTMRIGAQVAEGPRVRLGMGRRQAAEHAAKLLARVGFQDPLRWVQSYPHELSGGMRQRAMIAIALSSSPSVVLCDEPTTALDATVTLQILDLLRGLADELGIAIVLVTHDLGVVARVCQRVVVMYGGKVIEEGPTSDVLRCPRHPYTLALLTAVPTRDGTLADMRSIPGRPPDPDDRPPGCPFSPRCALAEPACGGPVTLAPISVDRKSACRRNEILAERTREVSTGRG